MQDREQPAAQPLGMLQARLLAERPLDAVLDQIVGIRDVVQPGRGIAAQARDVRDDPGGKARVRARTRHRLVAASRVARIRLAPGGRRPRRARRGRMSIMVRQLPQDCLSTLDAARRQLIPRPRLRPGRGPQLPISDRRCGARSARCAGGAAPRASKSGRCGRTARPGSGPRVRSASRPRARRCASAQGCASVGWSLLPSHHQENWQGGRSPPCLTTPQTVPGNFGWATRLSTTWPTARMPAVPSALASQYMASARHWVASARLSAAAALSPWQNQQRGTKSARRADNDVISQSTGLEWAPPAGALHRLQ